MTISMCKPFIKEPSPEIFIEATLPQEIKKPACSSVHN
jgi:hypothetical protein